MSLSYKFTQNMPKYFLKGEQMKAITLLSILIISACAHKPKMKVNKNNIKPGTKVTAAGNELNLHKGSIKKGDDFTKIIAQTNGKKLEKKVSIINIVPSIDTPVCEEQTHILGESDIHPAVELISISRDLPMAQERFAKLAKLENITYISDYKDASFGKNTGLLIKENALLTRGVIVLDDQGKIHYMQFVDDITQLPDMKKAIKIANELAK